VIKDIAKLVSKHYPGEKYDENHKETWKTRLLDDNYRSIKNEVTELIRLEYDEFREKSNG
jgi:hypothetical protein